MEHGSAQSVLIVTGEASGDMHGAHLVREMRSLRPEIQLYGMGGKAMREAGVTEYWRIKGNTLRYARALRAEQSCLACHGQIQRAIL